MQPSGSKTYLKTKIMTATPAELRLMLIEGAIRFSEQARNGLAEHNYEACYLGVTRAQDILLELINSLRPEHDRELCQRLSSLYTFMYTQLIRASTEKKLDLFDEVVGLLEFERETWTMLLEQLARENGTSSAAAPAQSQLSMRV